MSAKRNFISIAVLGGYASFQYIKLFKVDYLKLDGELIRNMAGNNGLDQAVVTSIVSLAGSLGIKTVAEYVESAEILDKVRLAGIDYAQGYHIRRPMPDLIQTAPYPPAIPAF